MSNTITIEVAKHRIRRWYSILWEDLKPERADIRPIQSWST